MTLPPDFDQLVGADVEAAERARLERVHALLVQAGPPAELSPELEAGPALGLTLGRRHGARPIRRGVLLLAAAIAILALAFLGGYVVGNGGGSGTAAGKVLKLTGTPAAPSALASLHVEPVDAAGNWPMQLTVTGLPKLQGRAYYAVFLVRDGKPYAPCGAFKVASGRATTVELNAPYRLKHGDTWVVTRQAPDSRRPGTVVLRPV
jgi:hypothetical protein